MRTSPLVSVPIGESNAIAHELSGSYNHEIRVIRCLPNLRIQTITELNIFAYLVDRIIDLPGNSFKRGLEMRVLKRFSLMPSESPADTSTKRELSDENSAV